MNLSQAHQLANAIVRHNSQWKFTIHKVDSAHCVLAISLPVNAGKPEAVREKINQIAHKTLGRNINENEVTLTVDLPQQRSNEAPSRGR